MMGLQPPRGVTRGGGGGEGSCKHLCLQLSANRRQIFYVCYTAVLCAFTYLHNCSLPLQSRCPSHLVYSDTFCLCVA